MRFLRYACMEWRTYEPKESKYHHHYYRKTCNIVWSGNSIPKSTRYYGLMEVARSIQYDVVLLVLISLITRFIAKAFCDCDSMNGITRTMCQIDYTQIFLFAETSYVFIWHYQYSPRIGLGSSVPQLLLTSE